jgi:hypothetical protein
MRGRFAREAKFEMGADSGDLHAYAVVTEGLRRNSGYCERFSLIVSRRSGSSARRVLKLITPIVS